MKILELYPNFWKLLTMKQFWMNSFGRNIHTYWNFFSFKNMSVHGPSDKILNDQEIFDEGMNENRL